MLGVISFWLGFGLCLGILSAPCGYRSACCGPHCGRESVRVLASLLGSYPSGVRHLSRVWGPVGVAHLFHPSLLLGEVLFRLCGRPFCSSMAMSWRAIRFALVLFVDPVRIVAPLTPCLCCQSQSLACGCSCRGASPLALASVGAHEVCSGSTFIALHRAWSVSAFCRAPLGAQVGVSYFSCATFRMYSWQYFCQFH